MLCIIVYNVRNAYDYKEKANILYKTIQMSHIFYGVFIHIMAFFFRAYTQTQDKKVVLYISSVFEKICDGLRHRIRMVRQFKTHSLSIVTHN